MPGAETASLRDAIRRFATQLPPPGVVTVPLGQAAGEIAAEDICSKHPFPDVAVAAIDGYALGRRHLNRPLEELGNVPVLGPFSGAGTELAGLPREGILRVERGAPLPSETAAVVGLERTVIVSSGRVAVRALPRPGEGVTRPGDLFGQGKRLVRRGSPIGPREVALLGLAGHAELPVLSCAGITVMSIGDEIVAPGVDGHRWDVTGEMILASLRHMGLAHSHAGIVADEVEEIRRAVRAALGQGIVIACGGTGQGVTDRTIMALRGLDVRILFEGIAMSPGGTTAAALGGPGGFIGIGGDPRDAAVCLEMFIRPALKRYLRTTWTTWDDPVAWGTWEGEPWPDDDLLRVAAARWAGLPEERRVRPNPSEDLLIAELWAVLPPRSWPKRRGPGQAIILDRPLPPGAKALR